MNIYFSVFLVLLSSIHCYNIDIISPYVKSISDDKSDYFGFSLEYFQNKKNNTNFILTGAINNTRNTGTNTGNLFYCPVNEHENNCIAVKIQHLNKRSHIGYSIAVSKFDDYIYTCGPGYIYNHMDTLIVQGLCYQIDGDFKQETTFASQACLNRLSRYERDRENLNCFTGAAIEIVAKNTALVSAPYFYQAKGLLTVEFYKPLSGLWIEKQDLTMHKELGSYQLMGSSMALGNLIEGSKVDKTVVMGGPSISMTYVRPDYIGYGMVGVGLLVDKVKVELKGLLIGGDISIGYGTSILLIDIDNDGKDELLVGAPYFGNNIGQVYVYWTNSSTPSNPSGLKRRNNTIFVGMNNYNSLPLSIDTPTILGPMVNKDKVNYGMQFGSAIGKIGDINKDGIQDFVVGSPFEENGSGCIYVYLGNRDRKLPVSQRICGQEIDKKIKGFGFSFSKSHNVDLDSNGYWDILVGAVFSNKVFGLRTRPLIDYYDSTTVKPSGKLPHDVSNLPNYGSSKDFKRCIKLQMMVYFYFLKKKSCPKIGETLAINFKIELDKEFYEKNKYRRVLFSTKSPEVTGTIMMVCKNKLTELNLTVEQQQRAKNFDICFPSTEFIDVLSPITITTLLKFNPIKVPKQKLGEPLTDLWPYPFPSKPKKTITKKIYFGKDCKPNTCQPKLDIKVTPFLKKLSDEYVLYISNNTDFKIKVKLTNQATDSLNKSPSTILKVKFDPKFIALKYIKPSLARKKIPATMSELIDLKVLEAQQSTELELEFKLLDEFIRSGNLYMHVNVSAITVVSQPHLSPINIKIKMVMVVDIDMRTSLSPPNPQFRKAKILGFMDTRDEAKIGPKVDLEISLVNRDNASKVMSSKLVVFIPWEIAGNVTEPNGQFLLYLTQKPKFIKSKSTDIICDSGSLDKLVNIIDTKIYEVEDKQYKPVISKPTKLPDNLPVFPALLDRLIFSNLKNKNPRTDWEKTVLLSCRNGSARCKPIVCDIGPLSMKSGMINVKFEFRLWIYTFIENFLKYKSTQIDIPIFWVPTVKYDIFSKSNDDGFYKEATIIAHNLQIPVAPPSNLTYIYITIAVIVAVILLSIIVIILYKCRFFQRQTIKKRPPR